VAWVAAGSRVLSTLKDSPEGPVGLGWLGFRFGPPDMVLRRTVQPPSDRFGWCLTILSESTTNSPPILSRYCEKLQKSYEYLGTPITGRTTTGRVVCSAVRCRYGGVRTNTEAVQHEGILTCPVSVGDHEGRRHIASYHHCTLVVASGRNTHRGISTE
jgi:hypothetical protein